MTMLEVANDLEELRQAYDDLQVLASGNNCDSGNVASVLSVLNKQFDLVCSEFEKVRKPGGVKLKSVNQSSTI
ncbi:MAG: hypothetical protein M0R33_09665 [Methylomonas sp.]|jgi:hypothetical protein|uniref:hypothetical protein n=1 Tax=Methylomonas sp. TaxID=418 RepID=UPI0025F6DC47|nr:hypothetical protein [Methylomonas sp.]MCK9606698.1 hypothetical protein [Methylomonas sp.]